MAGGTVLCITGDETTARAARTACDRAGVGFVIATDVAEASRCFESGSPALVICDFDLFDEFRRRRPGIHALLIVDPRQSDQTIRAMRHGALDCLTRPLRSDMVESKLRTALEIARTSMKRTPSGTPAAVRAGARLVGQSPAMQEVYKLIGLIAPQNVNVLITGESGTGKELVARAIHEHSEREAGPFLAINCAAIPEGLLESDLFGHERGAFTGADRQRVGKFEACDGGTLFLDEIGDMPLAIQAKLLRVLQDRSFQRVGGNETIVCDVRIIAATHQALDDLVSQKRFRADLYFRLKVASVHMPPLREREVDVVLLAHYIVDRVRDEFGTEVEAFSPETVRALLLHSWPGNVRELENVIKSALTVAKGTVLQRSHLPASLGTAADESGDDRDSPQHHLDAFVRAIMRRAASGSLHEDASAALNQALIRAALEASHGNRTAAAELLGISRTTLRKKIDQTGGES